MRDDDVALGHHVRVYLARLLAREHERDARLPPLAENPDERLRRESAPLQGKELVRLVQQQPHHGGLALAGHLEDGRPRSDVGVLLVPSREETLGEHPLGEQPDDQGAEPVGRGQGRVAAQVKHRQRAWPYQLLEWRALLAEEPPVLGCEEPVLHRAAHFLGETLCLPYLLERSEERRVGKECRSRWSP